MDPFAADDDFALDIPRLRVSLRISGDGLDPDFLTQQLGMMPTLSARKGDPLPRERGGGTRDVGVWVYRPEVPPDTELGDAIDLLLASLPEDATLWEELTSTFAVDVFCGVFMQADNQSTRVDAAVLGRLARLGLPVSFDLYAPFGAATDDTGR